MLIGRLLRDEILTTLRISGQRIQHPFRRRLQSRNADLHLHGELLLELLQRRRDKHPSGTLQEYSRRSADGQPHHHASLQPAGVARRVRHQGIRLGLVA